VTCSQTPPDLPPPAPGSEKQIIERFFMNNKEIRQVTEQSSGFIPL